MEQACKWTKDTNSDFWHIDFWHIGCQDYNGNESSCWWTDGDQPEEWEFCPFCGNHIIKQYQGEE